MVLLYDKDLCKTLRYEDILSIKEAYLLSLSFFVYFASFFVVVCYVLRQFLIDLSYVLLCLGGLFFWNFFSHNNTSKMLKRNMPQRNEAIFFVFLGFPLTN